MNGQTRPGTWLESRCSITRDTLLLRNKFLQSGMHEENRA